MKFVVLSVLHVVVALVFLKGFLLTRVELPDTSSYTAAAGKPAYSKAVVLIVDALRYDFLCDDGSSAGSYRGRLPKTLGLVGASVSDAKLLVGWDTALNMPRLYVAPDA